MPSGSFIYLCSKSFVLALAAQTVQTWNYLFKVCAIQRLSRICEANNKKKIKKSLVSVMSILPPLICVPFHHLNFCWSSLRIFLFSYFHPSLLLTKQHKINVFFAIFVRRLDEIPSQSGKRHTVV